MANKAFNSLQEYAEEFFSFLEGNLQLFPDAVRRDALKLAALEAALARMFAIQEAQPDLTLQRAAADDSIERDIRALEASNYPSNLTETDLDAALATLSAQVSDELDVFVKNNGLPIPSSIARLTRLAFLDIVKDPDSHLTTTGLVFAGYGDHDVFPSMIEYASSGIVLGRFVWREASKAAVDYQRPAGIKAFAQTSMTDTFTLGVSMDVFMSLSDALNHGLQDFVDELFALTGTARASVAGLDDLIREKATLIRRNWLDAAQDEHQWPMRRVLASLPIDELAELAETLIRLQSLKEKVTKPSETVGGPVDVAVITKNEGLVWIRRKHYFDASLNPRFMKRLNA